MASEAAAILLEDIQGEKSARILKPTSKLVCPGELLLLLPRVKVIPRKDGKPPHNYQLASDPAVTLHCSEEVIAPLADYEYHLLEAVKYREARFEVFVNDVLDWGSKLKPGMFVKATLPSKALVNNQSAVSRVDYVGPLPNENGIQFGVQIMDPAYRGQGSSNGFFGGVQFFACDENCGMFVSLDRLKPMEGQKNPQEPHQLLPSHDERKHGLVTRSQVDDKQHNPNQQVLDQSTRSPKPYHSQFNLNDRVVVYDKKGIAVHGSVQWMDKVKIGGHSILAVGIETDVPVHSKEFEGSLSGLHQYFKCRDRSHGKIVMPEAFVVLERVDAAKRSVAVHSPPGPQTQYGHEHPQPGVQLQGEQGQSQMSQFPSGQSGEGGKPKAIASQEISHSFSMGSTVQLLSESPRYGVIQWIGL